MSGTRFSVVVVAFACFAVIGAAAAGASAAPVLTVLTHSSFSASKEVIAAFETATGATVRFVEGGDAGETLGKAILSRGNPIAFPR
jgi:thiamine transport system substrate-binding protein